MAIIQDWKIRSRSKHCCHSEKAFEDGDEFYTCLFEDPETDGYLRKDFAAEVWDEIQPKLDPPPFSFWKSTFEIPAAAESTEPIERHSAEAMLRHMIEEDDPRTENARYILAIMLERKKTLKPVETRETETSKLLFYEHKENGDVFIIADPGLHLSEIEAVQEEVSALLRGESSGRGAPEPEETGADPAGEDEEQREPEPGPADSSQEISPES